MNASLDYYRIEGSISGARIGYLFDDLVILVDVVL